MMWDKWHYILLLFAVSGWGLSTAFSYFWNREHKELETAENRVSALMRFWLKSITKYPDLEEFSGEVDEIVYDMVEELRDGTD